MLFTKLRFSYLILKIFYLPAEEAFWSKPHDQYMRVSDFNSHLSISTCHVSWLIVNSFSSVVVLTMEQSPLLSDGDITPSKSDTVYDLTEFTLHRSTHGVIETSEFHFYMMFAKGTDRWCIVLPRYTLKLLPMYI